MIYKDLIEGLELISKNVGNQENKVQKKLIKIYNKLKTHYDEYDELRNDYRLEHASVDEKGNVVLNEKGDYVFTKDALKNLQKDLKALLLKEFEYTKIDVINASGLEEHFYLQKFVTGVEFIEDIDD